MELTGILNEWLSDVVRDPICVSTDRRIEARENLWKFSLTEAQASDLSVDDLVAFVSSIMDRKHEELQSRKLPPMLFYLWFEEMSGRLCFSLTSEGTPKNLDFDCRVNPDADLQTVLTQFLSSDYLDGIPFSQLAAATPDDDTEVASDEHMVLDVFVAHLL